MVLPRESVRACYDRLGSRQDWMHLCEAAAINELVAESAFGEARAVFELGCGTGRLAARLLEKELPGTGTYLGIDLSRTMVQLARRRLRRFGSRAQVRLTEGELPLDAPDETFDRFVSTYVLDLLPPEGILGILGEAHRVLKPGGLVCLTSLCPGCTRASRLFTRGWEAVFARRPSLLGGCRPIELLDYVSGRSWRVSYFNKVVRCGFPSDVVVAAKNREASPPKAL